VQQSVAAPTVLMGRGKTEGAESRDWSTATVPPRNRSVFGERPGTASGHARAVRSTTPTPETVHLKNCGVHEGNAAEARTGLKSKPNNEGLTKRVSIIAATCLYSLIGPQTTVLSM